MNLDAGGRKRVLFGIPRVSGGEPIVAIAKLLVITYSPRERG